MANVSRWTLTDVDQQVWVEELTLGAGALGADPDSGACVRKFTLHGGLGDGMDVVEVCNGPLSFTVLPTRGMGLWRGDYRGRSLGWCAPVHGPVHPKFVHASERGGLGWLGGFDECIVRCGLESNGAPGVDVVPNNMGQPTEIELGLHGRIANIPAHFVEVRVEPGDPSVVTLVGMVDESMLFCPQFRLVTEISTAIGSNTLRITDCVRNIGSTRSEMELLYHCNFGAPFLEEGSRLVLPSRATMPRDTRAAETWRDWAEYRAPTAGYVEQCYWHVPLADDDGRTVAMLQNAAADAGVAVRFNTGQLPCFTQWKNTAGIDEGYVTGLEPATNYPNTRTFERKQGRVVTLDAGGRYDVELELEVHDTADGVARVRDEVERLQGEVDHVVHEEPVGGYSDID